MGIAEVGKNVGLVGHDLLLNGTSGVDAPNQQEITAVAQQDQKVQEAARSVWTQIGDAAKRVESTISSARGLANGAYRVAKWSLIAAAAYGACSYVGLSSFEAMKEAARNIGSFPSGISQFAEAAGGAKQAAQEVYSGASSVMIQSAETGATLAAAGSLVHTAAQGLGATILEVQNVVSRVLGCPLDQEINAISSAAQGYGAVAKAWVIGAVGAAAKLVVGQVFTADPRVQGAATRLVGRSTVVTTSLAILAPRVFEEMAKMITVSVHYTGKSYVWTKGVISSSWNAVEGSANYEKTAALAKGNWGRIREIGASAYACVMSFLNRELSYN